MGVPDLCRESDILTVAHAFKMLTSPDESVAAIASGQLWRYARLRLDNLGCTSDDLASYMSGCPPPVKDKKQCQHLCPSLGSRLPRASKRLNISWSAKSNGTFELVSGNTIIQPDERRKVVPKLHHESDLWWRREWESLADQGKTVSAHCLSEYSNTWTRRPVLLSHAARPWLQGSAQSDANR